MIEASLFPRRALTREDRMAWEMKARWRQWEHMDVKSDQRSKARLLERHDQGLNSWSKTGTWNDNSGVVPGRSCSKGRRSDSRLRIVAVIDWDNETSCWWGVVTIEGSRMIRKKMDLDFYNFLFFYSFLWIF